MKMQSVDFTAAHSAPESIPAVEETRPLAPVERFRLFQFFRPRSIIMRGLKIPPVLARGAIFRYAPRRPPVP